MAAAAAQAQIAFDLRDGHVVFGGGVFALIVASFRATVLPAKDGALPLGGQGVVIGHEASFPGIERGGRNTGHAC